MNIRLLTLNCYSLPFYPDTRSRLKTLARELQGRNLDVVLFQEIHLWGYAHLLAHSLPDFPHAVTASYLYTPKGGLLTLSRLPVLAKHFYLFDKRGRWFSPGLADWMLHKGVLCAEIVQDGMPMVIINTHLVANYSNNWSSGNHYTRHQRAELVQLGHILKEIELHKLVFIAGDFNMPTDAQIYQEFLAATGLFDPLAEDPKPTYRPMSFLPDSYAQPLDHVLIRAPAGTPVEVSAQIVFDQPVELVDGRKRFLSDHYGIEVEISCRA